jgi:hypothetical protein
MAIPGTGQHHELGSGPRQPAFPGKVVPERGCGQVGNETGRSSVQASSHLRRRSFMSEIDPAEVAACQNTDYVVRIKQGHFVLQIGQDLPWSVGQKRLPSVMPKT